MKKTRLMASILFVFSFAIYCGGQSGDQDAQYHAPQRAKSKTIATIGNSQLKLFMLSDLNKMQNVQFESAQEEYDAKKELLDSLTNLYIMVEAAYEQGLDKDADVLKAVNDAVPDFMRNELAKLKIVPQLNVTDEEVRQWYQNMQEEVRFSTIYVTDSALADSLYRLIKGGADYADLARRFSEDPSTAVQGGDVGFIPWSAMTEAFQKNVYNLPSGELKLFRAGKGWHIVRAAERRPAIVDPFEVIEPQIRFAIENSKKTMAQDEFYNELRKKINIKINTETAEFIMDKIEALYPDMIGGKPFRKNTFNPDDLADYERNMILATYQGGEVKLGDYLWGTATWNDMQRPPFNEIENLKEAVFRLKLLDILLNEANELKLDQTDDFKDIIRFYKDQVMAARMVEIITEERSFVSDNEVIDYYQAHPNEFVVPKRLHVQEIYIDTEENADRLYASLQNGGDFGKLAEKHTIRPGYAQKQGDLGFINEYNFPTLYAEAAKLQVNQFSRPFPVGDHWSIVKLLEVKQSQPKAFEEVAAQIKTELQNQKRELAVSQWLAENKDRFPAKVNYDLIWETIDKKKYE